MDRKSVSVEELAAAIEAVEAKNRYQPDSKSNKPSVALRFHGPAPVGDAPSDVEWFAAEVLRYLPAEPASAALREALREALLTLHTAAARIHAGGSRSDLDDFEQAMIGAGMTLAALAASPAAPPALDVPRTHTGQMMLRGHRGAEREAWRLDILSIEGELDVDRLRGAMTAARPHSNGCLSEEDAAAIAAEYARLASPADAAGDGGGTE